MADPRTKAIDDVREIFSRAPKGPPPRTCPSCGAEHATLSPTCPSCDKRYDRRFARVSDRQRWALGGARARRRDRGGGADPPRRVRRQARQRRQASPRARGARRGREDAPDPRAAPAARPPRRVARPAPDREPRAEQLAARRQLVVALEGAILADARSRVAAGRARRADPARELRAAGQEPGHAHRGRGPLQDARAATTAWRSSARSCSSDKVVGLLGHPFVGTADFKRFTYVWCKDNKVPGERGQPLAKVPIPAVCIGAEGQPRVGDGYLSESP